MGPKKGKAKGKGKKGKAKAGKAKPPPAKKSYYLARIVEMNEILAQLRRETFQIEQVYFDAEKKHEQLQEDLADAAQYLEHEIKVCDDEIPDYDREINKYSTEIYNQKKYYEGIYTEMDVAFERKKRALMEIKQSINAKLNTYEEIRRQRGEYLKRREALEKLLEEMNLRHKEEMYEREKQAIIEQDKLQKEMEKRLDQLALDLREATDIRIGETTNRIIGDNIKLGNMLTCQQEIFTKMRDNFTAIRKVQKDAQLDLILKQGEYDTTFTKYMDGAESIEDILQMIAEMTGKIDYLKKLVKSNRRLKRKIVELECFLKDLDTEQSTMLKSLEEVEDTMAGSKGNISLYQKLVIKLQFSLYEIAKKVKEAIECENLIEENEDTPSGENEPDQVEEAEKEKAYSNREVLIDEIVSKLQPGNQGLEELYPTASSIEFHENSFSHRSLLQSLTSKRSRFSNLNIQKEEEKD